MYCYSRKYGNQFVFRSLAYKIHYFIMSKHADQCVLWRYVEMKSPYVAQHRALSLFSISGHMKDKTYSALWLYCRGTPADINGRHWSHCSTLDICFVLLGGTSVDKNGGPVLFPNYNYHSPQHCMALCVWVIGPDDTTNLQNWAILVWPFLIHIRMSANTTIKGLKVLIFH